MHQGDIAWLLSRAVRANDGSYRVILSKATPGRPVGRIRFHGTRADDPNDVVPHEHRRELRGYFVFAAWLNHVDAKGINSLSSLITENGRSFIRHYLLDFGSALGSAAVGPREGWEGYEALVEQPGEIGKRASVAAHGSSSGLTMSPSVRTVPFMLPSNGRRSIRTGTSLATGSPRFVITYSPPESRTSSINARQRALNSPAETSLVKVGPVPGSGA